MFGKILKSIRRDLQAAYDNDPAARGPAGKLGIIFFYPGFHAIVAHRLSHLIYDLGVPILPKVIALISRFWTGVEIHPAARIGDGFFIDHGMGVVNGETAVVGDDCTIFHQVTLGGTGKQTGKRHPTVGNRVVIGGGAKILGNIEIGDHSYIGANSVVLTEVPDNSTVVGIPGRVVRYKGEKVSPCDALDHIHLPDPVRDRFSEVEAQIEILQKLCDEIQSEKDREKTGV